MGGFVASISLALNVPGNTFYWHAPSAGTVDVNALDASGAIIIGTDVLANPIQLSLPSTDAGAFSITGMQQLALQQPAQSLPLAYDGSILLAATVTASTTDENSQPFATSIPIPIGPPTLPPTPIPTLPPPSPSPAPTPTLAPGHTPPPPTPTPPPRSQFSLYVYDVVADRIIEYAGINAVETGQPLSTTPRRIFEIAAPSAAITCPLVDGFMPALTDIAVSSTGTIFTQTLCTDTATSTLSYTFAYAAATQEVVPPISQGTPIPPLPTTAFSVNPGTFNVGSGLALDEAHNQIWQQFIGSQSQGGHMIGVQLTNPTIQTAEFGSICISEYQEDVPCTQNSATGFIGSSWNFAVDAGGFLYVPNSYGQYLSDGTTAYTPPGSPTEQSGSESAITVFAPGTTGSGPTPYSVLAGFHDDLGAGILSNPSDAIEGSTLYSLINAGAPVSIPGNPGPTTVFPGLAGCNDPPSAAAIPDSLTNSSCVSGNTSPAVYLVGFANATQTLTAAASQNSDVVNPPTFELGGDVVGGFGGGASTPGRLLAVHNGFAYVLNPLPPSGGHSEIDVYNTNGVSGFHTDIQPITRLVFDPTITPGSIAIGPTGTGLGGQALLRRPARAHHNIRAWAAHLRQIRLAQQQRRGMLLHRPR